MKASNILAISDLHLSENPADQYRHDFMRDLIGIIQRRQPDALLINGDLTQEKDRHSAMLVNKIVKEIDALAQIVPVAILMGNHDYLNEGHPFFAFLHHIPNIEWIGRAKTASGLITPIFRKVFEGCLFLPHTRDYKTDWADYANRFGDFRIIFAHNTFNGAAVGFGRKLEGIPLDIFPEKAKVVAGDIHVPQTTGPVTYIGAPYTVNFGDDYSPRLLNIRGRALASIGVGSWTQKRLVEVDDVADLRKVDVLNAGDIVKVRVSVDDMGTWSSTHKAVREWADKMDLILFRAEPVLTRKVVRKNVKVKEATARSDDDLLSAFAKRHSVDDATLKVGVHLLKEA